MTKIIVGLSLGISLGIPYLKKTLNLNPFTLEEAKLEGGIEEAELVEEKEPLSFPTTLLMLPPPSQIKQLLKLLPSKNTSSDTEEEIDNAYAGMTYCSHDNITKEAWIIDSGASDHMTGNLLLLLNPLNLHN